MVSSLLFQFGDRTNLGSQLYLSATLIEIERGLSYRLKYEHHTRYTPCSTTILGATTTSVKAQKGEAHAIIRHPPEAHAAFALNS